MVTRIQETDVARQAPEPDAEFAGWDPYIVSITGGVAQAAAEFGGPELPSIAEAREIGLMVWLREHGG